MNLNLIRRHIIKIKKDIKALCDENGLPIPDKCRKDAPQRMDPNFIAREDEIHDNAVKALSALKKDKDYQYLVEREKSIDKETRENSKIDVVLSYVKRLEGAIKQNDFVTMRLYESDDRYFKAIHDCAKELQLMPEIKSLNFEKKKDEKPTQLSLFD